MMAVVQRLRQRIFTASQKGNWKQVRNLQKLMLRSYANAVLSVRRVTELNAGKSTPGVDGRIIVTPDGKARLAQLIHPLGPTVDVQPVRRVYIPKANGKRRPLGIPVILDRARQALVVNALEPEWEARFESRSYGFRPGRGAHDAIEAIFHVARGPHARRLWVLDADLTGAFDHIAQAPLLAALGTFPALRWVQGWLQAGVVEQSQWHPTEAGTPQGGVISPLLLNIALQGMEAAAGVRYEAPNRTHRTSPVLVRYADDFVVLCTSQEQVEQVQRDLTPWLQSRGLSLNPDKTRVVHLAKGFDFLGFHVRRYGTKLLIKPSSAALHRHRQHLRAELHGLRGRNVPQVIQRLNPLIRGWTNYYRTVVSSAAFASLDRHLWQGLYKWAKFSHPHKPKGWIVRRYFGAFHPKRQDRWVFGDTATGLYVVKHAWTAIRRHRLVRGAASPDNPAQTQYWAVRRRRTGHLAGTARPSRVKERLP
jgi:RNA-directed DNA polymerase